MSAARLLAVVASAGLLFVACDKNESAPTTATASPSTKATTIPPSASASSPTPAPSSSLSPSPSASAPIVCNIHPCHGLKIECSPAPQGLCTEIYMMGDFCRGFAECEVIDGKCVVATRAKFTECKECLAKCAAAKKQDCDAECRKTMNVH